MYLFNGLATAPKQTTASLVTIATREAEGNQLWQAFFPLPAIAGCFPLFVQSDDMLSSVPQLDGRTEDQEQILQLDYILGIQAWQDN